MRPNLALFALVTAGLMSISLAAEDSPSGPPPGAKLIGQGYKFAEGPAIDRAGILYFSDVRGNMIYKWDGKTVTVFAENTGGVNGLAIHKDGSIYGCAGSGKAIVKYTPDGKRSVVLDKLDGKPLNSVNDLVFDSKGNLFFTNPVGMNAPKPGEPTPNVVRLGADGTAKIVATEPGYPNGIKISPDGKTLYVNDTLSNSVVWKYPLSATGEVGKGEIFIKFGSGVCDGLAVAQSGNVYVVINLGAKIVKVSPDGKVLDEYRFPRGSGVSNVCFAGKDMKTLYVTLGTKGSVYEMPADEPGLKLYSHQ